MYQKLINELGKLTVALVSLFVMVFLALLVTSPQVEILNYGKAYHFYNSEVNRLYIGVTGRAQITHRAKSTSYVLLANHPRENTFDNRADAYSDMIKQSGGASTISFIMGSDNSTVIERRYQSPKPENLQHECVRNPYNMPPISAPAEKSPLLLTELHSIDDILSSASRGRKIFGTVSYKLDGVKVALDFPASVININPKASESPYPGPVPDENELWQVVSDRLPVYIGGNSLCSGIREGHAALRQFDGPFEIVYLCRNQTGANDFSCSRKINGKVRIFAAYF